MNTGDDNGDKEQQRHLTSDDLIQFLVGQTDFFNG